MTQTTAVRVESILESHLHLIPLMVGVDGESADIGGMTEAAQKIAAEIDTLTRERDEARAEIRLLKGQDAFIGDANDRQAFKAARTTIERILIRARAAKGTP
jgi:cell division protein FtsB